MTDLTIPTAAATTPAPSWWLRPAGPSTVPWRVHTVLWALLLGSNAFYWLVRRAIEPAAWDLPLVLTDVVLTVAAYAGLFYLSWFVIIPRHLSRNRPWSFLLVMLLAIATTALLRYGSNLALGRTPSPWPQHMELEHPNSVSGSFMDGLKAGIAAGKQREAEVHRTGDTTGRNILPSALLVLLLSVYLRLSNDHQHDVRRRRELERQRQELEKQHLAAELSLLKAQINPHFLFNTLNNIYSLASEADPEAPAATAVLQLSDLMRYLLYESSADTVPLAKEIDHLRSFLSLQLLRLPGAAPDCLRFGVAPEVAEPCTYPIAPMLLLPLVENAFKHGDLTVRPHAVELALALPEGRLEFSVRNRVRAARPHEPRRPGGVGLANLRRRLQLLYPGRHRLQVEQTADSYFVQLTLLPSAD
ncbi:sensor histidine kinase [Hymenobacter sp. B81]|uniref:sensor histidine kinase n=1 Tax=Hymenobacter sp. B81 TaxID=3344878 RepID=UPI0037DC2E89